MKMNRLRPGTPLACLIAVWMLSSPQPSEGGTVEDTRERIVQPAASRVAAPGGETRETIVVPKVSQPPEEAAAGEEGQASGIDLYPAGKGIKGRLSIHLGNSGDRGGWLQIQDQLAQRLALMMTVWQPADPASERGYELSAEKRDRQGVIVVRNRPDYLFLLPEGRYRFRMDLTGYPKGLDPQLLASTQEIPLEISPSREISLSFVLSYHEGSYSKAERWGIAHQDKKANPDDASTP